MRKKVSAKRGFLIPLFFCQSTNLMFFFDKIQAYFP